MPANSGSGGGLARYRAKRAASRTPEPFGSGGDGAQAADGPRRFVVQKHAARRLHYDFRLEWDGVLWSWAVPRGPSLDPGDKRMAVMVENHPLEYADFEGVIPEGNYGAGEVIVWDRGVWHPVEDPDAGLVSGKLLFDLEGEKLRGRWTLVRTKRKAGARARHDAGEPGADGGAGPGQGEWLLIKKPDAHADPGGNRPPGEGSVLSGLTIEELAGTAPRRSDALRAALEAAGAPRADVLIDDVKLMLCEPRTAPVSGAGWVFEIKYDGFRMLAGQRDGRSFLRYRRGSDVTATYPEIELALRSVPCRDFILDGEVVVLDEGGRPRFGRLQDRAMLTRPRDVARAQLQSPVHLLVFDLLAAEGHDARPLPLYRRKELLRQLLPHSGVIRYVDHIPEQGEAFYAEIEKMGLEGMVGKRIDSPYRAGRSGEWIKVRSQRIDDFAVVGWTTPGGASRVGFGGLQLAAREEAGWVYVGKVGGGLTDAELASIRKVLDAARPARYDFELPPNAGASRTTWVEPELVVEVRYKEWTRDRRLRQPTFLRLRIDKRPEECALPPLPTGEGRSSASSTTVQAGPASNGGSPGAGSVPSDPTEAPPTDAAAAPKAITFTNLDKVFWPDLGATKGDLIEYYRDVAPYLLPYLADRPLVLTRYPDGIDGKSFYQKDAPTWAPPWVRTESVWSEHSERDIHYFVCDDVESLQYVVNLGTIPLHVWSSCVRDLAHPDWCIIDLDPKGAPFADVVACAQVVRRLSETIGLEPVVKTSGSTGLHVLIPLGRLCTYQQSRTLAGLLCRLVEAERPDIATMARVIGDRGGKVYLDWLQNRHGQLLVAPLSVRPLPGAPVSMPLRWSEVTRRLDHTRFTIKNARRRLDRLGDDPVRSVLTRRPDLLAALARLEEYLAAHPVKPLPSDRPGRRSR